MPGSDFLDLPARVGKPRGTGITHVLDRGFPLAPSADLLATGGPYVDVWKFGWGISCLDPNLAAKLELLAAHRVLASPGGTLLEIAWAQGRAAEFLDWTLGCGFPCVEVSAGTGATGPVSSAGRAAPGAAGAVTEAGFQPAFTDALSRGAENRLPVPLGVTAQRARRALGRSTGLGRPVWAVWAVWLGSRDLQVHVAKPTPSGGSPSGSW